ncbi:hypothetical protein TNCT_615011 [Trichonephila clavata]|uniref:Uncharacterized protein n=1 Tax=Trichonephila clavata TaxID=2740835 RepID=A0A8X6I3Q2_TRICU|nr:hypothetical protein TNCT_615011 [Trichonephila clavata]
MLTPKKPDAKLMDYIVPQDGAHLAFEFREWETCTFLSHLPMRSYIPLPLYRTRAISLSVAIPTLQHVLYRPKSGFFTHESISSTLSTAASGSILMENFQPTPLQKMVARDIPIQTPQSILGPNKLDHALPPLLLVSAMVSLMVFPRSCSDGRSPFTVIVSWL